MALGLVAAATLLSGCVYRMNIQQGNYLEGRTVDQLQVGMTRSQVRYLLGTPMVPESFDKERWDYLYYFKRGRMPGPTNGTWSSGSRKTRSRNSSATTYPSRRPWRRMTARPSPNFPRFRARGSGQAGQSRSNRVVL